MSCHVCLKKFPHFVFQTAGDKVWKVHDVAIGFIFYDNMLFQLPDGIMASITSPRRLDFMIAYYQAKINDSDPLASIKDAKLLVTASSF